jgi:hypothetical protein
LKFGQFSRYQLMASAEQPYVLFLSYGPGMQSTYPAGGQVWVDVVFFTHLRIVLGQSLISDFGHGPQEVETVSKVYPTGHSQGTGLVEELVYSLSVWQN